MATLVATALSNPGLLADVSALAQREALIVDRRTRQPLRAGSALRHP